jgi:hypothetical protein
LPSICEALGSILSTAKTSIQTKWAPRPRAIVWGTERKKKCLRRGKVGAALPTNKENRVLGREQRVREVLQEGGRRIVPPLSVMEGTNAVL